MAIESKELVNRYNKIPEEIGSNTDDISTATTNTQADTIRIAPMKYKITKYYKLNKDAVQNLDDVKNILEFILDHMELQDYGKDVMINGIDKIQMYLK